MDLSPFTRAGLKFTEISKLLHVSSMTVSRWMRKKANPHPFITDKVEGILEKVDAAVERGDLPLSPEIPKEERLPKILTIVGRD